MYPLPKQEPLLLRYQRHLQNLNLHNLQKPFALTSNVPFPIDLSKVIFHCQFLQNQIVFSGSRLLFQYCLLFLWYRFRLLHNYKYNLLLHLLLHLPRHYCNPHCNYKSHPKLLESQIEYLMKHQDYQSSPLLQNHLPVLQKR